MSKFNTCWDRVARAEIHRQTLTRLWNDSDGNDAYTSRVQIGDDGTGTLLVEPVYRSWVLPFSFELGEFLYQLRAALDSCIYDAAALHFKQDPPPHEDKWEFVFRSEPAEFEKAMGRMKNIVPDDVRGLMESVQPYTTKTARLDQHTWRIGETLWILNNWARIDRHRRLHVCKNALSSAKIALNLPPGMTEEFLTVNWGNLLEDESEVASFKIANYVPGTKIDMDCKLAFQVIIDETPRFGFGEASSAMMTCVQVVREMFEQHFGITR